MFEAFISFPHARKNVQRYTIYLIYASARARKVNNHTTFCVSVPILFFCPPFKKKKETMRVTMRVKVESGKFKKIAFTFAYIKNITYLCTR